jgi:hypothetical protein
MRIYITNEKDFFSKLLGAVYDYRRPHAERPQALC